MVEIRYYIDRQGRTPFNHWFENQDGVTRARIAIALAKLESGNLSAAKALGAGVHELRLHFGPGYRIYFGRDGEAIVILLSGGTKKRQEADIGAARVLWQEYKTRKREE